MFDQSRSRKPSRLKIALSCLACGSRNYKTTKSRESTEPLILKKHCKTCNQHTEHREAR